MNSLIIRPFQDTPTIFGIRMSLIGDTVMALPMLNYFSERYERYNLIFSIAKKCRQAKELYLQDKRITAIKISDEQQSLGDDDYKIIRGLKPAIFEIYKDGVLIPQDATVLDYQKILEDSRSYFFR